MRHIPHIPLSVIVPVYNGQRHLKTCVHSILRQSFGDFRLILVDDGSTDHTPAICDTFATRDPRVYVIHQRNSGSIAARKAGIFSTWAQESDYLILSDADDLWPPRAFETLMEQAQLQNADVVCGAIKRVWKGIILPDSYLPPCLQIQAPQTYDKEQILQKLLISCYGISDLPVNLFAKVYKTAVLTQAADFAPVVRFMGEDLSLTLRILNLAQKLVMIPDCVYHYRIGGSTSKFMPYMMEDFLSLYRYKRQFPLPPNAPLLMDIELMNIVNSWLLLCAQQGKYTDAQLFAEATGLCAHPEIRAAADHLCAVVHEPHQTALWIQENKPESLAMQAAHTARRQAAVFAVKQFLLRL